MPGRDRPFVRAGLLLLLLACSNPPERKEGRRWWVPEPAGWVTDLAGIFDETRRKVLEEALAAFEKETTVEIAVLTVPSLRGEEMEAFSLRVANTWGVGTKDVDNGILLTVAPNDRKARIEVGIGLEESIPDEMARAILEGVMGPSFREGDFMGGIARGVEALMDVARR